MGQNSEIENLFMDEINSKKHEIAGLRNATKHKRLGKSKVMFASDYMSRSEKLKYRSAGEIMTTNMFDTILPITEFDELEKHEKKNRLQYWRTQNSNKEILAQMGITNKKLYDLVAELELPKAPRTRTEKKARTGSTKKKKETTSVAIHQKEQSVPEVQEEEVVQQVIVNGLNVIFNGTYSAEKIEKQLTKFMLLLEGEEDEFFIEFRLMQKQPKK